MAATSGAHPERNLFHYRNRLRELFGSGRFRIERDGRIRVLSGDWQTWGRVGDPQTVALLFPRERGVVAVELALAISFLSVFIVGILTAVSVGINDVYPGLSLWDVIAECVKYAAQQRGIAPAGGVQ